jgi:hypothetical protein
MKFFERDLCEKLVELECVSDGLFWFHNDRDYPLYFNSDRDSFIKRNCQPMFTLYDFIAPTEQARKNCEIVCLYGFHDDFRIALMQRETEHDAEQMIRKAVGL